jgi:hypothetical protein
MDVGVGVAVRAALVAFELRHNLANFGLGGSAPGQFDLAGVVASSPNAGKIAALQ